MHIILVTGVDKPLLFISGNSSYLSTIFNEVLVLKALKYLDGKLNDHA